ncbi:MAG: RnfABCDGE type electron transport complex subunit B [Oscillospiraceae bacterium]|jgi:Na+-translocating ferredoxin:NAD+ oxidoreductase RNF subunit RnfB|nr:RnfABCDGE type electron transport complex subunit B [Oscillospiraceae bacterium]
MDILYSVLALGGMGIVLGLLLALASRVFAVRGTRGSDAILELLPQTDCGACGFPGCAAFANELLRSPALAGECAIGGAAVAEKLSALLGAPQAKNTRQTALVRCSGGLRAKNRYQYEGLSDCSAATRIGGASPKECPYGCIGLGTCVSVCPRGAIGLVEGVAVVDHERCVCCMKCARACPKGIITAVPYYADVNVACSSLQKGAALRRMCDIGCLGCKVCEKTCVHKAIRVIDNLAEIDFDKCTGCGDCAEKCPRKLIVDAKLDRAPRMFTEEHS